MESVNFHYYNSTIDSSELDLGPVLCVICLNDKVTGASEQNTQLNADTTGLYEHFLDFCVHFLKVDIDDVLNLKRVKDGIWGSFPPEEEYFCTTCRQIVQNTVDVFKEYDNVKAKLLVRANELGLLISKYSSGNGVNNSVLNSFIKQVEIKCFTKAQIIQPSICVTTCENSNEETPNADNVTLISDITFIKTEDDHEDVLVSSECEYTINLPVEVKEENPIGKRVPVAIPDTKRNRSKRTTRRPDRYNFEVVAQVASPQISHDPNPEPETKPYRNNVFKGPSKRTRTKRKLSHEELTGSKRPRPRYHFECSECRVKFRNRAKIYEHNLTVHEGIDINKFLECSVCHEKTTDIINLQEHLKNMHESFESKIIFCFQCSESFSTRQLCELHNRLDHSNCPHILCEIEECREKFISSSDYREHFGSHCETDTMIYTCEQCDRVFLGLQQCELHKLYHISKNEEEFYVCPIKGCTRNNKYRNVNKLVHHFNQQHLTKDNRVKLHRCDQCKKAPYFIFRKELMIHLKHHTREMKCLFCNKSFNGRNALQAHRFNQHPDEFKGTLIAAERLTAPPNEKVQTLPSNIDHQGFGDDDTEVQVHRTCPYCSKTFLTFAEMEKHKAKEHNVKVDPKPAHTQCEICGLTLRKTMLPRHMLTHNEAHLPCPYPPCKKKFRRQENLTMHVKSVHDRREIDREFICDTCGRGYLSQGLLNRHVKERHIKPFACHLCPKTFSSVCRVNDHLRATHTDEKFQCTWCPNQYGWLCKLKTHAKKKHPDKAHLISSIYNYAMKPKAVQYNGFTINDKETESETATTSKNLLI